ncbi:histidine kinase [Janthinobacterium sp. BJB412]|nr:histidine kinase [Janthinobacterium sp. BJB412]
MSGRPALAPLRDLALQRKLLLVAVLTAAIAMLAALLTLASYDVLAVRPRLVQDLASRMELVTLNLDVDLNFGDRGAAKRTLAALRGSPEVHGACLFDARRQLFAQYSRGGAAPCLWPADLAGLGHRFHGDFLAMLVPVRFEREVVGYLEVDYAMPLLGARLRQYGLVLAVVLLTLFIGSLLHMLALRRLVTQPLLALSRVADRVTREQRFDLRSPVVAHDEVGRLAEAFNAMLATIAVRETELRRSQSLLNSIIEKTSAIVYVKGLDGRYLLVNQRFRQILPPGTPEPIGHHDTELFPEDSAGVILENDRQVRHSGQAVTYEEVVPDSTGVPLTYLSEKFPLLDERGKIWAICGVSTDISERKRGEVELMQYRDRLEELVQVRTEQTVQANAELAESLATLQLAQDELVRSEKLAALGALVAGVAHELNTPIGNSLLAVSTLIDQTNSFAKQSAEGLKRSTLKAFIDSVGAGGEIVLRNLHRAVDLVVSFKQVAVDRTTSQRRLFQLHDVVNEILLVLLPSFKKSGITVRQEVPPDIELDSYPGPFGQVMINLINNALSHAFDGHDSGEVLVTARRLDGGMIEVCVSDNGCGIAPENMGRIYDPFFTTKLGKGGSGLGLNIVYNIVYGLLGGKIDVDSTLGVGTRFVLVLPVKA